MKFLQKNKVLISALLSAIILTIQQALSSHQIDWKVMGFALLLSVLGVVANQWKGSGVTITGIIGTLAGVFVNIYQTGTFTWNEFILSSVVAILMAVSSTLQPENKKVVK
jgi:hypothetical protein